MTQQIKIKRGDTFSALCTFTDEAGDPVDLTGYDIACQIKRGQQVIDLDAVVTDAGAGQFTISAAAGDTEAWAVALYKSDVEFTIGSVVSSTDTFYINVQEDITNAA